METQPTAVNTTHCRQSTQHTAVRGTKAWSLLQNKTAEFILVTIHIEVKKSTFPGPGRYQILRYNPENRNEELENGAEASIDSEDQTKGAQGSRSDEGVLCLSSVGCGVKDRNAEDTVSHWTFLNGYVYFPKVPHVGSLVLCVVRWSSQETFKKEDLVKGHQSGTCPQKDFSFTLFSCLRTWPPSFICTLSWC